MSFIWKRVSGNMYDVFFDEGWENWVRILVNKQYCHAVNGAVRVSANMLKDVHKSIVD